MTLLNLDNLQSIEQRIPQLEQAYAETVGMPVYEFCCRAVQAEPLSAQARAQVKVASIPVTAGGGLIGNFAGIVADIVREFVGVDAFVTRGTDVTGFQEAVLAGADIIFMADDDTCMAFNVQTGAQSDNSSATGRIFAALLEAVGGGVTGKEALVLGMGKVGRSAFRYLQEAGAVASWYDVSPPQGVQLDQTACCPSWSEREWSLVVECTTAPKLVDAANVASGAVISAPGIPFGIAPGACEKARRVIHDELESGIVTMLCEVL